VITFFKYQALGNDFVLIDRTNEKGTGNSISDYSTLAIQLCDRNFGVGSDGLIVLTDTKMDFYNPDGTVDFCGNGIRCTAFHIFRTHPFCEITLMTKTGPIRVSALVDDEKEIHQFCSVHPYSNPGKIISVPLPVTNSFGLGCSEIEGTLINPGTPHFCIDIKRLGLTSVDQVDIDQLGVFIENNSAFSEPVTVDFIDLSHISEGKIRIRIWERGVGETLGCGTGALSTGILASQLKANIHTFAVKSPGGILKVEILSKQTAKLTGAAQFVFSGTIN